MFQKLQREMTVFATLVTGLIVIAVSFVYLISSEKQTKSANSREFISSAESVISYLGGQTSISRQWMEGVRQNGKYILAVWDNGTPFLFNEQMQDVKTEELLMEAVTYTRENYLLDIFQGPSATVVPQHVEYTYRRENGQQFYISAMVVPKDSGYLSCLLLYPLRMQAEQILQQRLLVLGLDAAAVLCLLLFSWFFTGRMIRPAKESRQKQIQFIADASHELRTPLAVILSAASAMEKAEAGDQGRFLTVIRQEGQKMSRLVDDMLLLARADNRSWTFHMEDVEMDTLLLDVYEAWEPRARQKEIRMEAVLPKEALPMCRCDRRRMEQILTILVDNAVSYTPCKGKIWLKADASGRYVRISVIDNGLGVADEHKDKIFDRFYRADSSRSQKDHYGLGLCIASELVRQQKGMIALHDTPGGGAAFTVSMPVCDGQ